MQFTFLGVTPITRIVFRLFGRNFQRSTMAELFYHPVFSGFLLFLNTSTQQDKEIQALLTDFMWTNKSRRMKGLLCVRKFQIKPNPSHRLECAQCILSCVGSNCWKNRLYGVTSFLIWPSDSLLEECWSVSHIFLLSGCRKPDVHVKNGFPAV